MLKFSEAVLFDGTLRYAGRPAARAGAGLAPHSVGGGRGSPKPSERALHPLAETSQIPASHRQHDSNVDMTMLSESSVVMRLGRQGSTDPLAAAHLAGTWPLPLLSSSNNARRNHCVLSYSARGLKSECN